MKVITKYAFIFYAIILPFGSINPFNLSSIQGVAEYSGEQQGIGPYLFAICSLFAFLDPKVRSQFGKTKVFSAPLIALFFFLFIPTILYDTALPFPTAFFLKLFVAEVGFLIIAQYYYVYPKVLSLAMRAYAYTCVLIVVAFFSGLLDGYYFISNGRLWLFGENPNAFSFMMGLGALVLLYEVNYKRIPKWLIAIDLVSILGIFMYMILSGSRGSSLIIAFCTIILSYKFISKNLFIVVPIVLVAIYIIVVFVTQHVDEISILERFGELREGNDDRMELLREAFSLYTEKPILGFGRTGYVEQRLLRFNEDRDSHNLLLSTAVMSGSLGLVSLLFFLWILYKKCVASIKQELFAFVLFVYIFLMSMKTGDVLTFAIMWYGYAQVLAMTMLAYEHKVII